MKLTLKTSSNGHYVIIELSPHNGETNKAYNQRRDALREHMKEVSEDLRTEAYIDTTCSPYSVASIHMRSEYYVWDAELEEFKHDISRALEIGKQLMDRL